MLEFVIGVSVPIIVAAVVMLLVGGIVWLVRWYGFDKLRHSNEWGSKGKAGERSAFLELKKLGVSEEQVFRNVYVPIDNGTAEIDLVVVTRKGLMVFECKNYQGVIYGNGRKRRWIQYLGGRKNYFLSPVIQNRWHVKSLKNYFRSIPDLPVVPFVVTTNNAQWKLQDISPDDHVLSWTGQHFVEVYRNLPDYLNMEKYYRHICNQLKLLERPSAEIEKAHVERVSRRCRNDNKSQ